MTRYGDAGLGAREAPGKIDPLLWLIPLGLSIIGILMVTSTTSNFIYDSSGTPFTMGVRQIRSLGIGFALMLAASCVPIPTWRKTAGALWFLAFLMSCATLVPSVGNSAGGASRWLRIAGFSFQPSEIMLLAFVLEAGRIFDKKGRDEGVAFRSVTALFILSAIPLLRQPDLGSTILLLMICMGMFVERYGWKRPVAFGVICAALIVILIFLQPYRMRRINAFRDPYSDPLNTGFQTIQGLIAFANGGIYGAGLGHGLQKLQYLPAAYTDYIYAALGEELGLLGTLGALLLTALWMIRCRSLYNKAADGYDASIVWGITLTIILPLFINVAGVTNLAPLTGMPLPFISYGGSALIMTWMRLGILLRLQKDVPRNVP
jgi:cell division protein FtsW